MKKQTRSLLDELTGVLPERDTPALVESRGQHIITSVINLLESIKEHYGDLAAEELERRIINSIKAKDIARFSRAARRLK